MNDHKQVTLGTVITPPPDDCPSCFNQHVQPTGWVEQHNIIYGCYQCPDCGYDWTQNWTWTSL